MSKITVCDDCGDKCDVRKLSDVYEEELPTKVGNVTLRLSIDGEKDACDKCVAMVFRNILDKLRMTFTVQRSRVSKKAPAKKEKEAKK